MDTVIIRAEKRTVSALIKEIKVGQEGYIAAMDTEALGYAAQAMGAGRVKKTDVIDYSVGYILPVRIGDHVTTDTTLCTLYARNEADAEKAEAAIRAVVVKVSSSIFPGSGATVPAKVTWA